MKFEIQEISPKRAMEMLEGNTSNRNVKKVHLEWLTTQMKQGKWHEETGETIKIASTGKLLDGQHRLQALIRAGKTFKFLVVSGLDEKVFTVIDTGVARSGGDALHAIGVHNAFNISALIRTYWLIETKDFDYGKNVKRINSEDIMNIYKSDPQGWQIFNNRSLQFYAAMHRMLTQSFIGAWYKYLSERCPTEAEVFFTKLCMGVNIKSTLDPASVLREMLTKQRLERLHMNNRAKTGYFITVWNGFIENKKFKNIPWNPTKDPIPAIQLPKKEVKKEVKKK